MILEGVRYSRFRISFRLADGRRRSWIRWSPSGGAWIGSEITRELESRFTFAELPRGSNVAIARAS